MLTVPKIKKINVTRVRVPLDPSLCIIRVEILYEGGGSWRESFGNNAELTAFDKGLHAALSGGAGGNLPRYDVPSEEEAEDYDPKKHST